jgi:hypothetical protein
MNEQNILNAVSIEKDVDGFHPLNIGRLSMRDREPLFVPCTPKGCIELLHRYDIGIKGKRAVVIGRSNIVGMPAALLLQVRFHSSKHYYLMIRLNSLPVIHFCSIQIIVCVLNIARGKMLPSVLSIQEPRTLRSSQDKQILLFQL